jgi:hypothetical protein
MRRRIGRVVLVVSLILGAGILWWHPWSPSGPPPAKRYGSPQELASDLQRSGAGCERTHNLWGLGLTYSCSVAGGRLYFGVMSEGFLDAQEEFFGVSMRDVLTADAATVRDIMHFGVDSAGGVILGPNWMAFSDWKVTVEAAHDAIGGRLVLTGPPSPSARTTPS